MFLVEFPATGGMDRGLIGLEPELAAHRHCILDSKRLLPVPFLAQFKRVSPQSFLLLLWDPPLDYNVIGDLLGSVFLFEKIEHRGSTHQVELPL